MKKYAIKRIVLVVVVLVACVSALFAFLALSPKTLNILATPTLQRNENNTNRENDAAMIASALANYVSGHQSTLPQSTATGASPKTLDICGSDCIPANSVTVRLGYYANTRTAVSFHAYSSKLTVPDTQTVYIVPNANCNRDKSIIGVSTIGQKYLSIVVLYAIQQGTNTKQQCLSPY